MRLISTRLVVTSSPLMAIPGVTKRRFPHSSIVL